MPLPSSTHSPVPRESRLGVVGPLVLATSLLLAACAATGTATPSASPTVSPTASPAIAAALQQDFVDVVTLISPSVVVIETPSGLGSGIVFNTDGDIVTNYHIVADSTQFRVTLADGRQLDGTVVGTYPPGDIAVIHVTGTNLQPATFADSSQLAVGDLVLAVGNPLGYQGSVTQGIVSAVGRTVSESASVTLSDVIQTSAEINPGNSGGALVDLSGNVVGIPTLAALDPQIGNVPAPGIGFAIPSNVAVDYASQLIANGVVTDTAQPSESPGVAP